MHKKHCSNSKMVRKNGSEDVRVLLMHLWSQHLMLGAVYCPVNLSQSRHVVFFLFS